MNQITCKKCGTEFANTRRTCPTCGAHPRPESRPLPQKSSVVKVVKVVDDKAPWKTLTSNLVGLVIAGSLGTAMNDGTFSFLMMLLLYLLGYYTLVVNRVLGFHTVLGMIVSAALTCAATLPVGIFADEHGAIGIILLLALFAFPLVRGVVLPVYTLVRCKLDRC